MNREDFSILKNNLIYFDNGATTLKPDCILKPLKEYYTEYTANSHRGDYDNSLKVDAMIDHTRELVKDLIGAKSSKEIIFTSGTTDSLNKVIFGFFKNYLKKDDEVLLSKSEHASNVLPWFELQDQIGIKIRYIELDEHYEITLDHVKEKINNHTKVISLAEVTNVIGDVRPMKEIVSYAHERGIYVLVDGAQSVPHKKVNVKENDYDFLTFSAHKMCGPTGVGVLYGKEELLQKMTPIIVGGGMNASFDPDGSRVYDEIPQLFEAGTPNIAGIIAYGAMIEYLNQIGMDKINKWELELKKYAVTRLKEIPAIKIYNAFSKSGIVAFNYDGIFAQDLAIYLNKYNICVRAGNHCAKILKEELKIKNTCRMSFYFYNTKEEIDKLVVVLKNPNIKNEIF